MGKRTYGAGGGIEARGEGVLLVYDSGPLEARSFSGSPADLRFLSKRQVTELLSISKTTLDVWRRERGFPQPIYLSGVHRWRPADIEAWISANCQLIPGAGLPRPKASGAVHASDG